MGEKRCQNRWNRVGRMGDGTNRNGGGKRPSPFLGVRNAVLRILAGVLTVLAGCLLSSCADPRPPASGRQVLEAMCEARKHAPDGRILTGSADRNSREFLSPSLLSALYGEAARGFLTDGDGVLSLQQGEETGQAGDRSLPKNDVALFLPTAAHPGEMAVFRCADRPSAVTAVKLCRSRLDLLRRAFPDEEWAALTDRAVVTAEGSYVLLLVTDDPSALLAAARRVIRSRG